MSEFRLTIERPLLTNASLCVLEVSNNDLRAFLLASF